MDGVFGSHYSEIIPSHLTVMVECDIVADTPTLIGCIYLAKHILYCTGAFNSFEIYKLDISFPFPSTPD
jgi:hypothetical protein